MNDSTIAFRAKEQLGKFLGKVFYAFGLAYLPGTFDNKRKTIVTALPC